MKTSMWIRLVLLTAVSLHLSACGKSKSDGTSVQTAPAADSTQAPDKDASNTENDINTNDTVDAEEPKGIPADKVPTVIQSKGDKKEDKKETTETTETTGETVGTKKESDKKAEKSEKQTQASGADRYTGSANDYLRSFLQAQEAELSQAQRDENTKAAQSILSANLKIDYNATGDVAMTLVIGNSKNKRTVMLGGLMNSNRTSKLRRANEIIQADLKCMDVTDAGLKSCETALVKVKMSAKANVNIIFRRTNMIASANFGQKQCMTQACEDIYTLFKQTEDGVYDRKNITLAKLESAEIIGGRSTFKGIIRTRGGEAIVIGGALVKDNMNQVADRTMKLEDLVDFRDMRNLKDNLHKSLNRVRIVGNDGIGGIRMRVDMQLLENGSYDSFEMNFQRISRDLMPLVSELK